ncbi:MAG TPA: hypothetical protein VHW01_03825, partial [Polyangiaceae bacterium]|nr:hypothetical protein [Polyangiaceae bacterium]
LQNSRAHFGSGLASESDSEDFLGLVDFCQEAQQPLRKYCRLTGSGWRLQKDGAPWIGGVFAGVLVGCCGSRICARLLVGGSGGS